MDISETDLSAEYERASAQWPFIQKTELAHGLPRMLLFAVGSRETNLTNETGDLGHGHGVWQLDDRFHSPPGGSWPKFDANVPLQCATAAAMLQGLLTNAGENVETAAAIYNSGHPDEASTTGGDYGIDVLGRMQTLQQLHVGIHFGGNPPPWYHRELALESPFLNGGDVTIVQTKTSAGADGLFGPVTRMHVVSFQSHHLLAADGIVGPITATALGS